MQTEYVQTGHLTTERTVQSGTAAQGLYSLLGFSLVILNARGSFNAITDTVLNFHVIPRLSAYDRNRQHVPCTGHPSLDLQLAMGC